MRSLEEAADFNIIIQRRFQSHFLGVKKVWMVFGKFFLTQEPRQVMLDSSLFPFLHFVSNNLLHSNVSFSGHMY